MTGDAISVLIPDGESHLALMVVRCLARAPGVKIHVLSTDPHTDVRFSRHAGSFRLRTPGPDAEADAIAIRDRARRVGARVVLPVSQPGTRLAIAQRRLLEDDVALAPLPSSESFATAVDKGQFAEFVARHAIAAPRRSGRTTARVAFPDSRRWRFRYCSSRPAGTKPTREFPRLCRGGSRSLTFPAVCCARSRPTPSVVSQVWRGCTAGNA